MARDFYIQYIYMIYVPDMALVNWFSFGLGNDLASRVGAKPFSELILANYQISIGKIFHGTRIVILIGLINGLPPLVDAKTLPELILTDHQLDP